jgi:hypothetical protein
MIETIAIARRFNGPPATGHGGYSAGVVAALLDPASAGAVEVTLRKPPPLETPMAVRHDGPTVGVYDSQEAVATALPSVLDPSDLVAGVPFAQASDAAEGYVGFAHHPFPTCFVCGPDRAPGDGLRLFPGRLPDGRTAAPFRTPDEISPLLLWAALDCPGGWVAPQDIRPYVLGRITAQVMALPMPGDECVIMGQLIEEDGRKASVRTTAYSPTGGVLAHARATWLTLPDAAE